MNATDELWEKFTNELVELLSGNTTFGTPEQRLPRLKAALDAYVDHRTASIIVNTDYNGAQLIRVGSVGP